MKKPVLLGLAWALAMMLSGPAAAQIYRTTDAEGNVIFTDTPPPGGAAQEVQLQHTNTAQPTPPAPPRPAATEATAEKSPPAPVVRIVSPANETTIPMGGGNFSVTARASLPLEKGQAMRLLLDGTPTGKLQPSGFWDLTSVDRGAHDLSVELVAHDGSVVASSETIRIYVMRPSVAD